MSEGCKCENCTCDIKKSEKKLAIEEVRRLLDDLHKGTEDIGIVLQGNKVDERIARISELLEFLR